MVVESGTPGTTFGASPLGKLEVLGRIGREPQRM
jgi:hypothetical protein